VVLWGRDLADWGGLAHEQRFIALQIVGGEHGRVSWHAVALGEDHKVAAHQEPRQMLLARSVP
jgi:hypothetical protein